MRISSDFILIAVERNCDCIRAALFDTEPREVSDFCKDVAETKALRLAVLHPNSAVGRSLYCNEHNEASS